jgi:signal transduction histidine kinase
MKLATKLMIPLLLLAIISAALLGFLAYSNGRRTIEQNTFDRLISTTRLRESEFERWIEANQRSLRLLAIRPLLRQYTAEIVLLAPTDPAFQTLHDRLMQDHLLPLLEDDSYLTLSILRGSDGLILVSTDERLEGQYKDREAFFLEGRRDTFVDSLRHIPNLGQAVLHISSPIHDADGKPVAVLAGHADLAEMTEIMLHGGGLSVTEESYLVNQFNFFVTEPRFGRDFALKKTVHTPGVVDCLAHNNGVGLYPDYRDIPVIGAYRWLPERQLCLLTEVDQAEAFAPIVELRRNILIAGGGIGLAFALWGLLLARAITRPVQQLVTATAEFGRGNLAYRLDLSQTDELGQLVIAFNTMAAQRQRMEDELRRAHDELELRVQERTAELARSNQDLEQFAYVASHDLQEPLRMVASYLQLLERRYRDQLDAEALEFIDYAVDGARRMKTLINDLLAYSRVGTQGKPFAPTECNVVLEQSLLNLEQAITENQAVITHDELPTVLADESQLVQLFQNLLSNALKFRNDTPPRIHVGVRRSNGEWTFWVQDNGIGFDPQFAERIFVIFQRLHGRQDYPGTGIGLAICKKIVERHRGRIWVESQPERGATVYFTLPVGGEPSVIGIR